MCSPNRHWGCSGHVPDALSTASTAIFPLPLPTPDIKHAEMAKMANLVLKIEGDDGEPEQGWAAWIAKPDKLFGASVIQ